MLTNDQSFKAKLPFVLNETVKNESTGKNEYKKIGEVEMPFPTLADFGIDAKPALDDKQQAVFEDGVPVFENEVYNWIQYAIVQQLKAQNRNKFDGGKIKEGLKLPENFTELVAVGERSGEALKARHESRNAFMAHLKSKGKTDNIVKLLGGLLVDADSIQTCQDKFADALKTHLGTFIESLNEEQKLRYDRTITKAIEALEARSTSLDDLN